MNCIEKIGNIAKIEAYSYDQISIPFSYINSLQLSLTAVSISGQPEEVIFQENSASATCSDQDSASGKVYTNTITWQTDENDSDVYDQISRFISLPYHFIITTFDGEKKLIFNWFKSGKTTQNQEIKEDGKNFRMNYSGKGLIPILTLI